MNSHILSLKRFFTLLKTREKIAFIGRLLFTFLCISLILYVYIKTDIALEKFYISIACLVTANVFFGKTAYLLIHLPLFLLSVTDIHLFKNYNLSTYSAGSWLYALIPDTNKTEVIEYFTKISSLEKGLLFSGLILSISCLFYHPVIKPRKIIYLIVFLLFPFSYLEHASPILYYHFFDNEDEILARSRHFHFTPYPTGKPAHNVIILIGESHRYPEFHLAFKEYARNFNALFEFNDLISMHPGTMNAVPMILSRKKFTDKTKYFSEKSIFSFFKEAGYNTYFLHYTNNSAERNHLSFIYNETDHFINFHPDAEGLHDSRIYPELNKILIQDKSKKQIVIKMIGAHENFENRYPSSYNTRQPSLQHIPNKDETTGINKIKTGILNFFLSFKTARQRTEKNKDTVLNTYKNAIDYSSRIVADIITLTKNQPEPSLLLFSSDHGFCIYDKGYLHLPPNCQNAFHIPAMFFLNPSLEKQIDPNKIKSLTCNLDQPLTQEYFFETIVSLSGFSHPSAQKDYDLTNGCITLKAKRPVDILRYDRNYFYEDL